MAQPIPFEVPPARVREEKRLADAPAEHAAAILSAFELLQLLHDRGVLDLLRGTLGAGDEMIETVTASLKSPDSIRAIRNVLLLTRFLGSIPPEFVHNLLDAVSTATNRPASEEAPGTLALLGRMRSVNSRRGLGVALDLLEALGKTHTEPGTK
jgi:uncharacterized protein YjgD (DUF1641 family)